MSTGTNGDEMTEDEMNDHEVNDHKANDETDKEGRGRSAKASEEQGSPKTEVEVFAKSPLGGSNPRPYAYEAHALPTELRRRMM